MYPEEEQLDKIANWSVWESLHNFREFMDYVFSLWSYRDWGWRQNNDIYTISTAGWSGNEDIIDAMQQNFVFWSLYWYSTRVGGHHIFAPPKVRIELIQHTYLPEEE